MAANWGALPSVAAASQLVCASGCRIHFDELTRDSSIADQTSAIDSFGIDPETPSFTLACNTTVKLADIRPASTPSLSLTATTTGLAASWISDTGTVGAIAIRLPAVDSADVVRIHDNVFGEPPASRTVASIAANQTTVMIAAHPPSGVTSAQRFDADLTQAIGPPAVATRLDSGHGLSALPGPDEFAIATAAGTAYEVSRIRAGAASTSDTLAFQEPYSEHTIFQVADRVVVVGANAGQCQARAVDVVGGTNGNVQNWAVGSACSAGRAANVPGTNEIGLLRISGMSWRLTVATISGNTLSIGADSVSVFVGELPARIAATATDYWVTRVLGDQMFYDRFDRSAVGVELAAFLDTPVFPPLGHDIVVKDGTPYAVWIGGGFWIARLCPQ